MLDLSASDILLSDGRSAEDALTDCITKSASNLLQMATQSVDALNIDISGAKNGKIEYINGYRGQLINGPVSDIIATKVQYVMSPNLAIVKLYEMYPMPGREWINAYNKKWEGWRLTSGRKVLWQGEVASKGDTITLSDDFKNYSAFIAHVHDWALFCPGQGSGSHLMFSACYLEANTQITGSVTLIPKTNTIMTLYSEAAIMKHYHGGNHTYEKNKLTRIIGLP